MDGLFLEGKEVAEGEKTLASLEYHHAVLKGKLTRGRKCLRGWRKECPPQSPIPLPKFVVYGVAMIMKSRNQAEMAVKVLLDFDAYLRPAEGMSLKAKSVVPPVKGAGPQFNWHAIIIREFEDGQPDKVGVFDNSIQLNTPERTWLGPALQKIAKKRGGKNSPLFSFTAEEYRKEFSRAAQKLGLGQVHLYQLRHGGAADDINGRVRDHAAVKQRGRWSTDQSVRRYTKTGKVQSLLNQLLPGGLAFCRWSHRNMEKVFQGKMLAKSF